MAGTNSLDVDFQRSKLTVIRLPAAGSEGFGAGGGHLQWQEDASAGVLICIIPLCIDTDFLPLLSCLACPSTCCFVLQINSLHLQRVSPDFPWHFAVAVAVGAVL
jgi:hypothetical protein